jgi:site-specific recombinase XerD
MMPPVDTLTNDDLTRGWNEWMAAAGLGDKTRSAYRYALLRFLSELSSARAASQVSEQDVVVFLTLHATRGPSRNQYRKGLKSFFGWAAEHGHIPEEPTIHL